MRIKEQEFESGDAGCIRYLDPKVSGDLAVPTCLVLTRGFGQGIMALIDHEKT